MLFSQLTIIVCLLVLHPRHKLEYFKGAGWEASWIKAAREIVRDEYDRSYAFMDIDLPELETTADEVSDTFLIMKMRSYFSGCYIFIKIEKPVR